MPPQRRVYPQGNKVVLTVVRGATISLGNRSILHRMLKLTRRDAQMGISDHVLVALE